MNATKKAIGLGILAFLLTVFISRVFTLRIQPEASTTDYSASASSSVRGSSVESVRKVQSGHVNEEIDTSAPSNCLSIAELATSPEAHTLDVWFASWGAPPMVNEELLDRPYSHYSVSQLEALADLKDVHAMHELGLDLIWAAIYGAERLPNYKTLWDSTGTGKQYLDPLDAASLSIGRQHLYEAALHGRIYALIEIALSYTLERQARLTHGTLSDTEDLELQTKAFAFGEAAEQLVDGLHETFYQATVPIEIRDAAIEYRQAILEKFHRDRHADAANLPRVSDVAIANGAYNQGLCLK